MNYFAERLLEERMRLGLNQSDFGAIGSVRKGAQLNYEKGERAPDANYLSAISQAGVDVNYLLTGERAISQAELKEKINAELRLLADAYEAIDTALLEASRALEPSKKRLAAEALYKAFKGGDIEDIDRGAWMVLAAA